MDTPENILSLLNMLIARLERLSVDSTWAHHASGLRGSLLRYQEKMSSSPGNEVNLTALEAAQLEELMQTGFSILEKAALEIDFPVRDARSTVDNNPRDR
jgi:hypothetical protein